MPQDELSSADDFDTTVDPTSVDPSSPNPESAEAQDVSIDDPDLDAAKQAWEAADGSAVSDEELQRASDLAEPFVGRWNKLISTTNWEKGRIISEWRARLIDSGVDATQYSDEAWSRRVGGVTAPHVGRLRRVYDRFHDSYQTYEGLYWSHFLAALDWEDAPMWLEGASNEKWSISAMREKRWEAEGAVAANRPTGQIIEVDTDEDVTEPAQGGGSGRDFDNDGGNVSSGPTFEGPDFGEEEELQSLAGQNPGTAGESTVVDEATEPEAGSPVQPFIGLPALPDDVNEAIESLKLALLRHKAMDWRDLKVDAVQRYLDAIGIMIRS